jgi:glycosyltransferase involved in cell wall biosynthesis
LTTPKHIIIVGPANPLRGGIATFNERMAQELINEGHRVTIFTFSLQYPGFLFPGKTQYTTDPAPNGMDIRICVNSVNPFNWIKIGRILKKLKPDVLVLRFWIPFMGPCLGTIGKIAKKNKHTKVVGFFDNVIPHEHRPGDHLFTSYFIRQCDRFITLSQQVLNDLRTFTASKPAHLIRHPIYDHYGAKITHEDATAKIGVSANSRYILFFGFIRSYKGLDLLLEAMGDARIKNSNIKLIVAGEFYEDEKPYYSIIEKHQLEDRVVLRTEYISDEAVKYYFGAADLVVQPYRTATQSGITQMAYHFEKPMVVTNVGGLPEIVPEGKAGYVVAPEPAAIANAIHNFFTTKTPDSFLETIKEEKKKYSWKAIAEGILD